MSVTRALDDFVHRSLERHPDPQAYYDPDWRSPCERGAPFTDTDGRERIRWQPRRRDTDPGAAPADDFAGLEAALELEVHPDIKAYYGRYWSGGLEATAADGHVGLILLWNPDDVARLVENHIGHALAKRQAKSAFSLFFACTEADSELFLSVENHSGRILLERPGYRPLRTVADTLAAFLDTLEPAPPELR